MFNNLCTHDFFFNFVENIQNLSLAIWICFGKMFKYLCICFFFGRISFVSVKVFHNFFHKWITKLSYVFFKSFIDYIVWQVLCFFDTKFTDNFFLEFNLFFDFFVCKKYTLKHFFFGYFVSPCFNHKDCIFCSSNL